MWNGSSYSPWQTFWTDSPRIVYSSSPPEQRLIVHGRICRSAGGVIFAGVRFVSVQLWEYLTHQLARERREHRVFMRLLEMVPGLEERLLDRSEEGVVHIAELVCYTHLFILSQCLPSYCIQIQKGASSARSDDTKSLKSAILDWITPHGQSLNPPLARNVKTNHGFHHEHTGALLCPASLDWVNME